MFISLLNEWENERKVGAKKTKWMEVIRGRTPRDKIETEGDKLQTRLTSFALNRCCRFKRKILKDP